MGNLAEEEGETKANKRMRKWSDDPGVPPPPTHSQPRTVIDNPFRQPAQDSVDESWRQWQETHGSAAQEMSFGSFNCEFSFSDGMDDSSERWQRWQEKNESSVAVMRKDKRGSLV